jgi:ribosomal protein S18 acetylase RimI-like enzyme
VGPVTISPATAADIGALDAALRRLSADMGDTHRASQDMLAAALSGPDPASHALLARDAGAADQVAGATLFAPLFSTTRGMAGAYVSDLWVAPEWRGTGLGVMLLAAVRDHAARRWGAAFLRLGVYADNARARAFYDRLGFRPNADETVLTLAGPALARLKGAP